MKKSLVLLFSLLTVAPIFSAGRTEQEKMYLVNNFLEKMNLEIPQTDNDESNWLLQHELLKNDDFINTVADLNNKFNWMKLLKTQNYVQELLNNTIPAKKEAIRNSIIKTIQELAIKEKFIVPQGKIEKMAANLYPIVEKNPKIDFSTLVLKWFIAENFEKRKKNQQAETLAPKRTLQESLDSISSKPGFIAVKGTQDPDFHAFLLHMVKEKAKKYNLSLSDEFIETNGATLIDELTQNIYRPDVTTSKMEEWLTSLQQQNIVKKDHTAVAEKSTIIEDIIRTAKEMVSITLTPQQVRDECEELINTVTTILINHPNRSRAGIAAFTIAPWLRKKYVQSPEIKTSTYRQTGSVAADLKTSLFSTSKAPQVLPEPITQKALQQESNNAFQKLAQTQPWKTSQEAAQIAKTLHTVLKQPLMDKLTKEEIQALENESLDDMFDYRPKFTNTLVHRATIPANAELYIIGDLHGDFGPIEAVLSYLEKEGKFDSNTGKISSDAYIAFLGDYIDRGPNSLKNLWYLGKLKEINPDRVFLTRGNHETFVCTTTNNMGFLREGSPFAQAKTDFFRAFALLPTVTLLDRAGDKASRIALVHGGINPQGTLPLIGEAASFAVVKSDALSYLWNDLADSYDQTKTKEGMRGLVLGSDDITKWMQTNNVATIFHGHDQEQRSFKDEDNNPKSLFKETARLGMGSRWNDKTFVLNVAPNTQHYNIGSRAASFYSDYGVIACIKPKPNSFVQKSDLDADSKFASNTQAQSIITLPNYILEPIYFLPLTPSIIVPNNQVLATRPQTEYDPEHNLLKKE